MASMASLLNRYQRRKEAPKPGAATTIAKPVHVDTRGDIYRKFRGARMHSCRTAACQPEEVACVRVGILFIIIDSFPHEKIWRRWLAGSDADASRIRILIHAKHPERVSSDWVRERLVSTFQYKPEWGSIDLTRVMIGLMKEIVSIEDDVGKVIFASESCLPIVPVHAFVRSMTRDGDSWVNFSDQAKNGYANQKQWDPLIAKGFPSTEIYKGDQWNALSRAHVLELLACPRALYNTPTPAAVPVTGSSDTADGAAIAATAGAVAVTRSPGQVFHDNKAENSLLDRMFARVEATDEMYIPTLLRLCGHLPNLQNNTVVKRKLEEEEASIPGIECRSAVKRRSCTFVQWYTGDKISVHPETYTSLDTEVLIDARLCNHPVLNVCGSHNSARRKHAQYARIKAEHMEDLSNYRHSALFIRKIKTSSEEEEEKLFADWEELIITRGRQPETETEPPVVQTVDGDAACAPDAVAGAGAGAGAGACAGACACACADPAGDDEDEPSTKKRKIGEN